MTDFFDLTDILPLLFLFEPLPSCSFILPCFISLLISYPLWPDTPLSPATAMPSAQHWLALTDVAGDVVHRADCRNSSTLFSYLQFCDLGILRGEVQNPFFLFCLSLDSKMIEDVIFWCENCYPMVWLKCGYWIWSLNCIWGFVRLQWNFEELWHISMKLVMCEGLPWLKGSWWLKKQGVEEHTFNFRILPKKNSVANLIVQQFRNFYCSFSRLMGNFW